MLLYYSFNQGVAGGDNTSISSVTDNTGSFHGSLNNFALNGTTSNFVGSLVLEAPTANAATNITEGSFIANWTAPSGTTVNNYILEVAKDANFISLVPGYETLTVPGGTTSWEVNGLNPDVTYYYRVKAVIGAATSLSSNIISVKTLVLTGLGNALNFDGTNDYVTFSNGGISFPNNQWTEEMWVYVPSSIGADFKSLLVTNTISATTAALRGPSMYVINKTKLHGGYGDGTNWKLYTTSNEVFRLDAWTHITQTFDGTTLKIYVNGILSESFNMPGNSNVNKINYIGSVENAPSTEGFLGNIDEVRIWSRALTADEIKNNYKIPIDQSAVGSLQGLMAYYDFNQGIAEGNNTVIETLIDSKNAYNATLNNFTKDGANSNFVGTLKLTAPVANAASGITLSSFTAGWAMGTGSSPTPNKYFLDVSTDATFADASKFLPGYRNKDVGNVTSIDVTGLNSGTTYYYRLRAGYATPWFHPSVNSNTITVNTLKTNNITIAATDVKVYGDAPYQLAVSSSGTGAYTYTITAGDAVSISNTGQVTVLKAGTATIAVTQAADAVYGHGGPVTQTITVQPKGLTVTATAADKEYNGTDAASVTLSVTGTVYGDIVTATAGGATFDNKNVGIGKPVTVTGITFSGAKASNYVLANTSAVSASITAKPVKIILTANDKKYDGNTSATGSLTVAGVITGDNVTATAGSITFADKNAGTGKTVTATGISLSNNNYMAITPVTSSANITAKPVTVTFKANNKVFDNTTTATGVLTVTDLEAGDAATAIAAAMNFADPGIGTNKPVTATGISINNANYTPLNTTATSSANISGKSVTVTINQVASKVYDGNTTASATFNITGLAAGETVTVISADVTFADKNAGTGKTVTATNFKLSDVNYSAGNSSATSTGNITAKPVTVTFKANNKAFDNTTTATGVLTVTDLEAGDAATAIAAAMNFADPGIGTNKPVTATGISINNANYTPLNTTATSSANISGKSVTVTINQVASKVYDGNTTASATFNITGLAAGETVTVISADVTFADKNAGTGKTVTATNFKLSDVNYSAGNSSATSTGNITAKPVKIILTANDKKYDGNTSATGSLTVAGVITGDNVTATAGSITFADKNAGTGKPVTATGISLSNNNYMAITPVTSTANITAKPVTVTFKANNKVFDNTTTATGVLTVTDLEAGDAATAIAAAMNFADPSIGTNKPVTATGISINNTNYTPLNTTATSSANISGKSVTVTINQVASKVYDGNTTASATFNITGLAAGETVTVISADVTFADKNAGTGKPVTATNFKLSDVNYSAGNSSATSTGNITAKPVTVTFKANNKAFDNTTTATGVLTVTDLEAGDAATATATAMNFADPGIGTNKPVTATGISINNANYTPLNTTATSTANISGKSVTVIINQVASKVYDGNTTASATFNISGLAAGETLTVISADVNFVDKNVGTGKPVTATNFKFSDANYSASNSSANYTGNITAKPVKIILTVNDKEYDGSPIAGGMITVSASDLVSGETITATVGSITFADKNAGTDKPVTATGISLSNNNYMAITPVTSTANITAKPVTVTLSANNKPFDGNNTATGALTVVGKIASDDVRAAAGSILFDNANIGTNKPVTASGISLVGSDQGNYRLTNTTATSTANISGKGVTVSINKVAGKVYDGNTTASATFNISGLAAGETLTVISADVSFSDKNVGVGKAVTAGNFKLSDANYSAINTTATSTGNISPKDLTITADNKAKLPGEDNPPLTAGYSGFVNGENNTNALTVQPLLTTPATKVSPPGNYPIEVSGAVAANSNYNIVYNKGTLTISTVVITAVTLTTNTLYANSPTGTLAGRLTASSTDPKAIYTYSLVSGAVDNGKFTINGDKLYTNAVFNYATQSTFTVRIQVSTQSGGMLTKDFILTILYVNGSPTLDAIADQSVCATTDSHTINLSGITPGPEANQTTTLSIAGNNKDMFTALSVKQLSGGKGIINYSLKAGVTGSAVVTVTVKDDGGTADGGVDTYSVSFTVNVNPLPVISISTGTGKLRIIRGRTIELTANAPGATAYSWADAKGIVNGQSTAKLTVKPTERTVYTVKATSTAGCSDVKQITIEVGSEYSDVVANNIITPNGDGVNDVWVIENIEQYPNATVKVFDIAKHLIFSQTNYDNKWNGYFNGKPLHEGTYYYVIDFGTDLYKAKGHITIINEQ